MGGAACDMSSCSSVSADMEVEEINSRKFPLQQIFSPPPAEVDAVHSNDAQFNISIRERQQKQQQQQLQQKQIQDQQDPHQEHQRQKLLQQEPKHQQEQQE